VKHTQTQSPLSIGAVLQQVLLAIIPGLTLSVIGIILPLRSSHTTVLILLVVALVGVSLFYLWMLTRPSRYSWWSVVAGSVTMIAAGIVYGYHIRSAYRIVDVAYNMTLPQLSAHQYSKSSDFVLHSAELDEIVKHSDVWIMSHVVAGKGTRPFASAIAKGVLCHPRDFPTYLGLTDQGERLPLEQKCGRTAIHLRWNLDEDVWCTMAVEAGVFAGIPYQRTFDMDRYRRLSFDVFLPQHLAGNPLAIRLEDDTSIRNPDLKLPCSTNQVFLQPFLPRPDPNCWTTTPVTIPLSHFEFKNPDAWPHDYSQSGHLSGATCQEEAFPDRHHIAQVTFGTIGDSSGEMWISNLRFE